MQGQSKSVLNSPIPASGFRPVLACFLAGFALVLLAASPRPAHASPSSGDGVDLKNQHRSALDGRLLAAAAGKDSPATSRKAKLDALFARLMASEDQGKADRIVQQIWALWLKSGDAEVDLRMSEALIHLRGANLSRAKSMLSQVIRAKPDYAEAWNQRAIANFRSGDFEASLSDIARTLALEPRHFGALAGKGVIKMHQGKNAEALAAFERAMRFNPFLRERARIIPMLKQRLKGDRI